MMMIRPIALLLLLATAAVQSGCEKKTPAVTPIDSKEAYGMLLNDFAVLIDVREPSELSDGMAAPAQSFPLSKIQANAPDWQEFMKKLPKDKQVIVYCASGGRAQTVAEMLAAAGIKARNLGGYDDWVEAGLPTKKLGK